MSKVKVSIVMTDINTNEFLFMKKRNKLTTVDTFKGDKETLSSAMLRGLKGALGVTAKCIHTYLGNPVILDVQQQEDTLVLFVFAKLDSVKIKESMLKDVVHVQLAGQVPENLDPDVIGAFAVALNFMIKRAMEEVQTKMSEGSEVESNGIAPNELEIDNEKLAESMGAESISTSELNKVTY